jgi:hypothetical protein
MEMQNRKSWILRHTVSRGIQKGQVPLRSRVALRGSLLKMFNRPLQITVAAKAVLIHFAETIHTVKPSPLSYFSAQLKCTTIIRLFTLSS